ncbi:MAG: hypothetical protein QGG42_04775 [Phycisphaerae bacterium]|nr:hypothetical protein [Phycisphaerae bacterium]
MKRTVAITGMLLLATLVSCRKAPTNEQPADDASAGKAAAETNPAADAPLDLLDECQALLDKARKVSRTDIAAALEIMDEAAERLHDCTYTANQVYWLQMKAELDQFRAKLTRDQQDEDR